MYNVQFSLNSKSADSFDIKIRAFRFGVEIVKLINELPKNSSGFAVGSQLIRSGTSIGANIIEAQNCGSKKGFCSYFNNLFKRSPGNRILVNDNLRNWYD